MLGRTAVAASLTLLALVGAAPADSAPPPCTDEHWVGAWAASPSDASRGSDIADQFDASGNVKSVTRDETTRAVLTPTRAGTVVRVRLSNRFGTAAVTFDHAAIARRAARADGAIVPGSSLDLTFAGRRSVTVPAGTDVVSDAVPSAVEAFRAVAVSVFVTGDVGKPTEHFTARQTSFLTPEGAGDHVSDETGAAFTQRTTARPFVTGLEVLAPRAQGAVVTFGDSITDGYQGQSAGVPETAEGIDADGRYPDVLARRVAAAGRPLSVLNAGISGNRVLRDGTDGGNRDTNGPAALNRLDADVLAQAGVTTVVLLEGVNDLGQRPNDGPDAIVAGYRRLIDRLHAAGLRVVQGTLTPSGGAQGAYGTAETNAERQQINTWIRSQTPADGVVDFDAAVRDPADPSRIDPRYDGSDHLHFNLAGYRAMGEAVPLDQLADPACVRPSAPPVTTTPASTTRTLTARVTPRHVRSGRLARLRMTVRRDGVALAGARVRLGRLRASTNARGIARLRYRGGRAGLRTLTITAANATPTRIHIRVRRAPAKRTSR